MRKWKEQKGSITLFVLIAMLFFVIYLVGMYLVSANAEATQIAAVKQIKDIYEKDVNQIADVYATLTKEGIYEAIDSLGNKIPVPVGFSPIITSEQGNINTGFVIKNDTDGNEFVWIPCTIEKQVGKIQYTRYAFDKTDWSYGQVTQGRDVETDSVRIYRNDFSSDYYIESMTTQEKESIKQYNGFYLARYEAGTTVKRTNQITTTSTVVIQKSSSEQTIYPYNFVTYEEAKQQAEQLYSKSKDNVISRLCSSYAWDTAIQYIQTKEADYGVTSKGNYSNSLIGSPAATGITNPVNNIYDMAGNVYEWTTEKWTNTTYFSPVLRGGSYADTSSEFPAGTRGNVSQENQKDSYFGFRVALYL